MPKFLDVTNTTTARARLVAERLRVYNVKDYGATGLGTFTAPDTTLAQYATRETNAICAARDAAGEGGTVYFPKGTYLVSAPSGNGAPNSLRANVANQKWELAEGAVIKLAVGAAKILNVTADGVTVTGGVFDGSNGTAHDGSQTGFQIEGDNVTVRDVTVTNSPFYGIVAYSCDNITIDGCTVKDSYIAGIWVQNAITAPSAIYGVSITDCLIEQSSGNSASGIGIFGNSVTQRVHRIKVCRNTVNLPYNQSDFNSGPIGVIDATDFVVSDNVVRGGGSMGISCQHSVSGVISGNTVRGFPYVGIEVPKSVNKVVISGNIIDPDGLTPESGIQFSDGTINDLTVTGNVIKNFGDRYTLTFSGSPTGGNFTLSYGGFTTAAITYSTTAATTAANIQAALVALTSIGAGNATVTVSSSTVFTASIINTAGTLALGTSSLTGGTSPTLALVTAQAAMMVKFGSGAVVNRASITGNVLTSGGYIYKGIFFQASVSNTVIAGNVIDGVGSTGSSGVEFSDAVNGMSITGNHFSNLDLAAVRFGTGAAVTQNNITVAGNSYVSAAVTINSNYGSGASALGANVSTDSALILGTPKSGTLTNCTGLPVSGITSSTATALGVGSLELGHATDTTLSRSSAGVLAVEGVPVSLNATTATHTAQQIELGHASDTTLTRSAAGVVAVEGVPVVTETGTQTLTGKTISGAKAGSLNDATYNATALLITPAAANPTNYIEIRPSDGDPQLRASGATANLHLLLYSKGTGVVCANGVEVVTTTGTQTLTGKTISGAKAGSLNDATYNATALLITPAAANPTNYIEIRPSDGDPQLRASGATANQNLLLYSKGTGTVMANDVAVSTNSTTATHTAQQIELGHATDTTVSRTSAGQIAVEGNPVGIKVAVPASASATGVLGQWAADSSWFYVCTATNTWVRAALATW